MADRGQNVFLIIFIFLLFSCGIEDKKFDKATWNEKDDMYYANREKMVKDLMENHLKNGMTYQEVIDLLGQTQNYQNDPPNTIWYEIMVDYGWNIDPQKGKTLYIEFNKTLKKDCKKRSAFIREAIVLYIEEKKRLNYIDEMKQGYLEMAELNLEIADMGFEIDIKDFKDYEVKLSESDLSNDNNSEKRRYILC